MPPNADQDTATAVDIATLVADNKWFTASIKEMSAGVKDLQTKMDGHMLEMRTHYATSERVSLIEATLQQKAEKKMVQTVDNKIGRLIGIGLTAAATFTVSITIEIVRIIITSHP